MRNFLYQSHKKRSGFTLVEVILASTIFAIVGLIAVTVFINILRIQKRVALENAIYEDSRFMMERISREIRKSSIDYEEYYNKRIEGLQYGKSYGCYGTRFYNGGSGPASSKGNLGARCNDGTDPNLAANSSCVIDKTTLDINTGINPYDGNIFDSPSDSSHANAFCDANYSWSVDCSGSDPGSIPNLQNELYLIDSKGTEKVLLARKEITKDQSEHGLAILRLDGEDQDKDGIVEQWTSCTNNVLCCAKDFNCTALQPGPNGEGPLEFSLFYNDKDNFQGFVPISPSRTDVTSLRFYVAPLEDPRKAFAEDAADIQQQPHVTVVLTVQPSKSSLQNYTGDVPSITIQTTITSRVYNEVKSYYGKGVCALYY